MGGSIGEFFMANGNGTNLATPLAPTTPLAPKGKGKGKKGKGKKAPESEDSYSLTDAAAKVAKNVENYQYSTDETSTVTSKLANKRLAKLASSLLQS
jgi:hypothetical protein